VLGTERITNHPFKIFLALILLAVFVGAVERSIAIEPGAGPAHEVKTASELLQAAFGAEWYLLAFAVVGAVGGAALVNKLVEGKS
jgi:hypothetical protein